MGKFVLNHGEQMVQGFPVNRSYTKAEADARFSGGSSPLTTKGDLYTYSTLNARLPVGTDAQILTADSTQATGLKWAAAAGGGDMVLASVQTNSGVKTFLDTTMKLRNVANTFNGSFVNTNTADRIYTLKDGAGTLAFTSDITGTNSGTNTGDQTSIVGITGTKAQFDTAVTDGNFLYVGDMDNTKIATLSFIVDGGGSAITTGIKGDVVVDFACTINSVTMLADQSGSIVVDIWKDTYANYPPTVADTITASAKPTITTATKSQDTTLTGWATAVAAGSSLRFNVDSASTITRCLISLKVTKT